jgi:hypothetical protein
VETNDEGCKVLWQASSLWITAFSQHKLALKRIDFLHVKFFHLQLSRRSDVSTALRHIEHLMPTICSVLASKHPTQQLSLIYDLAFVPTFAVERCDSG